MPSSLVPREIGESMPPDPSGDGKKRMTASPYRDLLDACRRRPPRLALVLGSGLGDLANRFDCECAVPFGDVPDMEAATVAGHKGELRVGTWGGRRVLLFLGRLHYYEGHLWRRIEQPVAVARELGAEILFLTNAAGGIRADLVPGSLLPIRDHLEWTRPYPWRPPQAASRPNPYSARLLGVLCRAAEETALTLTPGIYAQVTGPCYETPAEIRALRTCGADAVGMSTAREVTRGHALGMECAALSSVTNRAAGLAEGPIRHEEVIAAGHAVREKLGRLIEAFLHAV
jgi:purine-nucleoside phosphorylase